MTTSRTSSREALTRPSSGTSQLERVRSREVEDSPFDPGLSDPLLGEARLAALVERLREFPEWRQMHDDKPEDLATILRQDSRLRPRKRGEIVCREGDYGNSAYVVISGAVRIVLPGSTQTLTAAEEGRVHHHRRSLFSAFAQLWRNSSVPEGRPRPVSLLSTARAGGPGSASDANATAEDVPIILQDVESILHRTETRARKPGELFGEIAAMGRTPRTASVFAEDDGTELLEIRWQGIRKLRGKFAGFRERSDRAYRCRALHHQLLRTRIFDRAGETAEIKMFLESGWLRQLFDHGLGYREPDAAELTIELESGPVVLEAIAVSPPRSGVEAVRVYRCTVPAAEAANPELRRSVLRAIPASADSQVVVLYDWHQGGTLWHWLGGDVTDALHDRHEKEVVQAANGDHEQLMAEIIRPLVMLEIEKHAEFHTIGDPQKEGNPVILEEGGYPDGLIVVRGGTVRMSRMVGRERRTVSYMGPNHTFGFDEILHNWLGREPQARYPMTLSAVRCADIVVIPNLQIERFVLPALSEDEWPEPVTAVKGGSITPLQVLKSDAGLDRSLIDFVVQNGFSNGTSALVIDLDRCTRCDDCVRACAATHDGNPRFIRHGPTHGHLMVANSCMHCIDPVCMIGCPTGAISRQIQRGEVVINDDTCIGCGTCASNCPYQNIRLVPIRSEETGEFWLDQDGAPHLRATKCDLSVDQIGEPACVRACPHEALRRLDLTSSDGLADWMANR